MFPVPLLNRILRAWLALVLVGSGAFVAAIELSDVTAGSAAAAQTAAAPIPTGPVKFYVVRSSFNGQPEFLFEIAQRFLGDGNRFPEIFQLNEGRRQPDGHALTNPMVLLPGWILVLPNDASGPGVQFGLLPDSGAGAQGNASAQGNAGGAHDGTTTNSGATGQSGVAALGSAAHQQSAHTASKHSVVVVSLAAGGAVLVAAATAVLVLLRRRRGSRPSRAARVVHADGSAAWTIDRALKILTAEGADEGIAFPGAYLVTADANSITVTLAAPSTRAPDGWTPSADGRTWSAALVELQSASARDLGGREFAALATLGATDDGRVLLNFAQARGPVSVDGARSAVDDVVEGWVSELTGNPWSGATRVVRVASRGDARLATVESFLADVDPGEHGVAVFEEPPTRAQGDALRALCAQPAFAWVLLIKGASSAATWRFTARDGLLSSGFLPDIRYGLPSTDASRLLSASSDHS